MGDVTTFESSGNGRARPMEVIPSGRERRQWMPEAKARIIAESMALRANVADIARRNDILPQRLYAWRREAREKMESDDAPAFVPAMVEEPKAQGNGAEIRINIKGMTIRVREAQADATPDMLPAPSFFLRAAPATSASSKNLRLA